MCNLLIAVVTGALLATCVADSRWVPYKRSAEDIISSHITHSSPIRISTRITPSISRNTTAIRRYSSASSSAETSLACGIGNRGNNQDLEQYRYTDRREMDADENRILHVTITRDEGEHILKSQCDGDSMLTAIFEDRENPFTIRCARLRNHLKKGKKNKIRIRVTPRPLARMNVEGANNDSRMVLEGREMTKEVVMRQSVNESAMCDESFYLDGIECLTEDCSELYLLCVQLLVDEQLANELFCDLLHYDRDSLAVKAANDQQTLNGEGSLFAGVKRLISRRPHRIFLPLRSDRRLVGGSIDPRVPRSKYHSVLLRWSAYLLPGVPVLGDTSLRRKGSSRCPHRMFVSELTFSRVVSGRTIANLPTSFRCSTLERNLSVGPSTYRCEDLGASGGLICQERGFLIGIHYNFSHPRTGRRCNGLTIECQSLECE